MSQIEKYISKILNFLGLKTIHKNNDRYNQNYILDIFKLYGYHNSIEIHACVDNEFRPIPWYTYPSIEYLKQINFSDKRIFEFGSGNSSLFWAERAKEVISVENDKAWFDSIQNNNKNNLKTLLKTTEKEYYNCILQENGLFDVIIIDGRYRDNCAKNAVKKLTTDGLIILDNSDRVGEFKEYSSALEYLKEADLIQVDFLGFGPLNNYTWATSFFFQRSFNFNSIKVVQPSKSIGSISEI